MHEVKYNHDNHIDAIYRTKGVQVDMHCRIDVKTRVEQIKHSNTCHSAEQEKKNRTTHKKSAKRKIDEKKKFLHQKKKKKKYVRVDAVDAAIHAKNI